MYWIRPSALGNAAEVFLQKTLAWFRSLRIMRGLGWGSPFRKVRPSGNLLLKKLMKTDVWALVGVVVTNYSETTSDSLIQ